MNKASQFFYNCLVFISMILLSAFVDSDCFQYIVHDRQKFIKYPCHHRFFHVLKTRVNLVSFSYLFYSVALDSQLSIQ